MYRVLSNTVLRSRTIVLLLSSALIAAGGCGDAPSDVAGERPGSLGNFETFHQGSGCLGCHDLHQAGVGGSNLTMVLDSVTTPHSGNKAVVLLARSGSKSFADGDATYDGICEVCHTQTAYHRNNASGDHTHYVGQNCLDCHKHADEFRPSFDHVSAGAVVPLAACSKCHTGVDPITNAHKGSCGLCHLAATGGGPLVAPYETTAPSGGNCSTCHGTFVQAHQAASHSATPGSGAVVIFSDDDHDSAGWIGPKPYFDITVDCSLCHRTDLVPVHGNRCETCHPTAVASLGSWNKTCSQGACHPTVHGNAIPAHWPFSASSGPGCDRCHNQAWAVPPSSCLGCHASYSPADLTPPVTTSDAKTSYIGAALIDFVMKDSGKVGLGTTFYKLDGGAEQVGSQAIVSAAGSHTLEFWSMDQAGNVEATKHQVTFTITADTTAPLTTSNAFSNYFQVATITLAATDASTQGVKATYYRLDGGAVQTGTTVALVGASGVIAHVLEFWSEDWSGNVETKKTANFTITAGTATIRLVWGNADQGTPPADPSDNAYWYIRRNNASGYLTASGSNTNPGWSGVDDVVVPVSAVPYYVDIWWWDSQFSYYDNTVFSSVQVKVPGEIVRLSY